MQIVFFVVVALLALIPASIAAGKGRSFGGWWLYGFGFFIIALIHSLVLKPETYGERPSGRGQPTCPSCKWRGQPGEEFCQNCGTRLETAANQDGS